MSGNESGILSWLRSNQQLLCSKICAMLFQKYRFTWIEELSGLLKELYIILSGQIEKSDFKLNGTDQI